MSRPGLRDSALIDVLEAAPLTTFTGNVWRAVRDGGNSLQCSACGGRWDDGTFDVLYTSKEVNGAIAETYFHLSRGQPIIPSQVSYRLFEIRVELNHVLKIADLEHLATFGINTSRYGAPSYVERHQEYPRTQEFSETAHFVGVDGLIVPNARWTCHNVIVFCDRILPEGIDEVKDHGAINWSEWVKLHQD